MTAIGRLRVTWSGFQGAPGVSTFYIQATPNTGAPTGDMGTAMNSALNTMFGAIVGTLPSVVTISYPSSMDVLEATDGALLGSTAITQPSNSVGTSATAYAGPAGVAFQWLTSTVLDRRRVRGRTFIVPLASTAYQSDGTIVNATLTSYRSAAQGLVTAADTASTWDFVVWHRPIEAGQPHGPRVGAVAVVTGSEVRDKVNVLRSRRD